MNMTKLRKALGLKVLVPVALTLTALAGLAPRSFAADTQDAMMKYFNTITASAVKLGGTVAGSGNNATTSTTTVILQLFYEGPSTGSYVTIGASSITFYAPYNVVDTSIGNATYGATGGTFDLSVSTMLTLGQLCDAINTQGVIAGKPGYNCTLVGGVRSDVSTNFLPNVVEVSGTNNLRAVGGYQVPTSTSALISLGIIPGQNRHIILNYCTANSAGTPPVQIYGVLDKFGAGLDTFGNALTDSNLVWVSPALAANTTTNVPLATLTPNPWLEFAPIAGNQFNYTNAPVANAYNGHVVARVNNYGLGAANQASTNFLACNWFER